MLWTRLLFISCQNQPGLLAYQKNNIFSIELRCSTLLFIFKMLLWGKKRSKPIHIIQFFFSIFRSWTAAREVSSIRFGTMMREKGFIGSGCLLCLSACWWIEQRGEEKKEDRKEQMERDYKVFFNIYFNSNLWVTSVNTQTAFKGCKRWRLYTVTGKAETKYWY